MSFRELLNDKLLSLIGGEVSYEITGVCSNLSITDNRYNIDGYKLVEETEKTWPDRTGNAHFPVDNYNEFNSEGEGMWEGSRKERRISLCKHIMKVVAEMSDEELGSYV